MEHVPRVERHRSLPLLLRRLQMGGAIDQDGRDIGTLGDDRHLSWRRWNRHRGAGDALSRPRQDQRGSINAEWQNDIGEDDDFEDRRERHVEILFPRHGYPGAVRGRFRASSSAASTYADYGAR